MFGNNYSRPVIGYQGDLNAMGRREVAAFHARHYAPQNLTVALVGDVDPAQARPTSPVPAVSACIRKVRQSSHTEPPATLRSAGGATVNSEPQMLQQKTYKGQITSCMSKGETSAVAVDHQTPCDTFAAAGPALR